MAFQDPFRFSFKPDSTHWYYWNNGVIDISTTTKYMQAPNKWKESDSRWKRSRETRGYIRSVTTPYEFVEFTAKLLRTVYYNGSIESKIYFLVERLNTDTMVYEVFIDGEIDLSTYLNGVQYNDGSRAVSAAIIEGGIKSMLDAAESTPQLIPINNNDCDFIKMDGLWLRGVFNYLTLAFTSSAIAGSSRILPATVHTTKDGDYPIAVPTALTSRTDGGDNTDTDFGGAVSPTSAYASLILDAKQAMNLKVDWRIPSFYYSNTSAFSQDIQLRMEVIVVPAGAAPFSFSQQFLIFQDATLTPGNNRTLTSAGGTTPLFAVNKDDRVYVTYYFFNVTNTVSASYDYSHLEGAVAISAEFKNATTVTRSYPLYVVVEKMLFAITGQTGILQSDYLTQPNARYHHLNPRNVRLTCGDALRNITTNPAGVAIVPAIKITWAEMVRYLKYAHGCAIDIRNGMVVIEPMANFFKSGTIIADVGEVKMVTDEPARDFMAASGKWGYPSKDYDRLNGRDEPNTTAYWKYPINRITSQEDCTTNIRTDPYGIEEARANLSGKKTTDANSDNDTFAIETEANTVSFTIYFGIFPLTLPVYPLYRPQNAVAQPAVTGLLFPSSMFNLTMLPILNLRRNGGYIRSMCYNIPNAVLKFQTTEKNPVVKVDLGAGVIDANADVVVADLDPAFFKPQVFHVDAVLRNTFLLSMRLNPDGCIRFYEKGVEQKGYPLEVGVRGADDNSYNMTLLCTEDTDLMGKVE